MTPLARKVIDAIRTEADDIDRSMDFTHRGSAGSDYKFGQIAGLRRAARMIREIIGEAARGEICEHGTGDGDFCEPCNLAYKEAAREEAREQATKEARP
jgi:hypothetical protein